MAAQKPKPTNSHKVPAPAKTVRGLPGLGTAGSLGISPYGPAKPGETKIAGPNGTFIPLSQWDFGYGKGVLQPPTPGASGGPAPQTAPRQFAPDSIYNDQIGLNKRTFDQGNTDLDTDERTTKYQFGFDDPTNPYSRVNTLKRDFLLRGRAASQALGARGHLYSGAQRRAIDRNVRDEGEATAGLRSAYDAVLEDIRRRRGNLKTTRENADLDAFREGSARQGL